MKSCIMLKPMKDVFWILNMDLGIEKILIFLINIYSFPLIKKMQLDISFETIFPLEIILLCLFYHFMWVVILCLDTNIECIHDAGIKSQVFVFHHFLSWKVNNVRWLWRHNINKNQNNDNNEDNNNIYIRAFCLKL